MKKIAFVCTGNTCRSPMAEQIFAKLLAEKGLNDYTVISCGTSAPIGKGMHPFAYAALSTLGIEPRLHTVTQAEEELICGCDLVIALTQRHLAKLNYPENAVTLDSLTGCGDISDPYGGPIEEYFECAKALQKALGTLAEVLPNYIKG